MNVFLVFEGRDCCDTQVITQSFTSRYELMSCITKLEFIKRHPCGRLFYICICVALHFTSQNLSSLLLVTLAAAL